MSMQMLTKFGEMAGLPERALKCDIVTCDSEMDTANRNYALLHYMKSMGVRQNVKHVQSLIVLGLGTARNTHVHNNIDACTSMKHPSR